MRLSSATNPSRLSNTFSVTIGGAVGGGEQRDRERHEVGGEAGERQRRDVDRAHALVGARPEPVGRRRHLQAHLGELHHHRLDVVERAHRAGWPLRRRCRTAMSSVPVSMRSPMISLSTGSQRFDPSTEMVDVPAP